MRSKGIFFVFRIGVDVECSFGIGRSHVQVALKALMKGVQKKGGEFEEDDLEDIVRTPFRISLSHNIHPSLLLTPG